RSPPAPQGRYRAWPLPTPHSWLSSRWIRLLGSHDVPIVARINLFVAQTGPFADLFLLPDRTTRPQFFVRNFCQDKTHQTLQMLSAYFYHRLLRGLNAPL